MMMESCSSGGMFFGLLGRATPLFAVGAIIYLIAANRQNPHLHVAR